MKIVICGLSITSSWGNGHATTYRALVSALHRRGHKVVFLEKNQEWYESNRDLPDPQFCHLRLFEDWRSTLAILRRELQDADVAIVGSYFPHGVQAVHEVLNSKVPVKAFYDIDTPITLAKLRVGKCEYLEARQISGLDVYFSFTGGPLLRTLETEFGVGHAVSLYCSFEESNYRPHRVYRRYKNDLSYMGTYAADRQDKFEAFFLGSAKVLPGQKFLLAGPQYPRRQSWPTNLRHIQHVSPRWHPHFYSSSRFTLNLTRQAMVASGFSPSVRLFEAAACGCPIISDYWSGLDTFLVPGEEILVAENGDEVISILRNCDPDQARRIANRARERVLAEHGSTRRVEEFESYVEAARVRPNPATLGGVVPSSEQRSEILQGAFQLTN